MRIGFTIIIHAQRCVSMARVIVIYDSKTGLTERMTKAVVEGIKTVEGVEAELLKAGAPFSIFKLCEADAIIFGSPTHYVDVTREMRVVLESAKWLKQTMKCNFSGKIGGIFGSYAWDGGWVIKKLGEEMKALGIKIVSPIVSAVDRVGEMGIRIDKESLQRCRELGKTVAIELCKSWLVS